MRDIIFRFWCWCFIKWESKNFEIVEYGPKTGASCESLLLTLAVENIKISSSSAMFYVFGFLKFTTMMIGIVYIIPQLLSRNKVD